MNGASGISPSLFDFITDYAKELEDGTASVGDSIGSGHGLVLFCENFLAQFSVSALRRNIEGLNERSRDQLRHARRRIERQDGPLETQQVLFQLEYLCSSYEQWAYSQSYDESYNFHEEYTPELLRLVVRWMGKVEDQEARDAAAKAEQDYLRAVGLS